MVAMVELHKRRVSLAMAHLDLEVVLAVLKVEDTQLMQAHTMVVRRAPHFAVQQFQLEHAVCVL
jgi:hypothetical protein